jgi:hypothetical protein
VTPFYPNREEIEKQKAKERYMKMHLAGKTEQAKADLARLAIIRKQREEAARKKEEERKGKSGTAATRDLDLLPILVWEVEGAGSDRCLTWWSSQGPDSTCLGKGHWGLQQRCGVRCGLVSAELCL